MSTLAAATAHAQRRIPERTLNTWIARADALVEGGRDRAARRVLERAADRAPDDPRAPLRLARLRLPGEATAELASPDDGLRESALGIRDRLAAVVDAHRGEPLDAHAEVRSALAWATAVAGDHRGAIEDVSLAAGRLDDRAARDLRRLAALAVHRHDLAAADEALDAAQRADPIDVTLLTDHATVRLARGRPQDAVTLLQDALQRRPDDDGIRRDLGGALLAAGRATEALDLFATLAVEHPDDPGSHVRLARAALEAQRPDRALRAARAAAEHASAGDPEPALVRAAAHLALDQRDAAAEAYREVLRRDPGHSVARRALDSLGSGEPADDDPAVDGPGP